MLSSWAQIPLHTSMWVHRLRSCLIPIQGVPLNVCTVKKLKMRLKPNKRDGEALTATAIILLLLIIIIIIIIITLQVFAL
jgi:hypothetical protein